MKHDNYDPEFEPLKNFIQNRYSRLGDNHGAEQRAEFVSSQTKGRWKINTNEIVIELENVVKKKLIDLESDLIKRGLAEPNLKNIWKTKSHFLLKLRGKFEQK